MILFFFFLNDTSIISISKRCQNRMGINCFCFPVVAPFQLSDSSNIDQFQREIKYFRNERARFGINAISRLFFFLPLFFRHANILFAIILLHLPKFTTTYYFVLYRRFIYICIYLLFCPGDRKIEGKTHRVVRPPDNLSLIRDDLAIIGGRISRYILFQSKFISASLHTRTHAAVYLIFFSLFLFFSPPSSSFYFDQKAIYFSTAFERAYDFLIFCDKRWLLNRTTISELMFYYALRFFFFFLLSNFTQARRLFHT